MKFICDTDKLKNSLEIVQKNINSSNTLPILNNILLQVSGKRLTLSTTNLESAIKHSLEVDVINEGEITLPAKIFINYISFLSTPKVEISNINTEVEIKSEKSKTKIKGISAEEFPLIPQIEKNLTFTVSSKILEKAIKRTIFVTSNNQTRPILSGVYFTSQDDKLAIVATDGYRLSEQIISLPYRVANFEAVLPARTLSELTRALTLPDAEQTEIIIAENQILFKAGATELYSRVIEGKFPDYKMIIPKESTKEVTLKTNHLLSGVRQMSVLVSDQSASIKLKTTPNSIILTNQASQIGEGETEIPALTSGEDLEITLNADFLISALGAFDQDDIKLFFKNTSAPVIIRPLEDKDFLHLIMPLKS